MECTKCHRDQPLEQFRVSKGRGRTYRRRQCLTCLAEYFRQRYLSRPDPRTKAGAKQRCEELVRNAVAKSRGQQ